MNEEFESKQRGPYGPVTSGRSLHVCGLTCTVLCFALWFIIPTLLLGIGSGVGIGYGAFHNDNPCFDEMNKWKFEEGVDPTKHPIALVVGEHLAVAGHTVSGDSCIVRFSETLKAKGLIYSDHLDGQGRRLSETCLNTCVSDNFHKIQTCRDPVKDHGGGGTELSCVGDFCSTTCGTTITKPGACLAVYAFTVKWLTSNEIALLKNTCISGGS